MINMMEKIKKQFSGFFGKSKSSSTNITNAKLITSNLAGYLVSLSDFQNMDDEDVYEQLYVWEPEIGSAVDRISSLVRQSYKGITLKNIGEQFSTKEQKCIDLANEIAEDILIDEQFETYAELLMIHGNVFLHKNKDLTYTILPNKYCAIIDSTDHLRTFMTSRIMVEKNYLAFNEGAEFEYDTEVYPMNDIVHIKYKDTPIFMKDNMGRNTYGFYSISPLHRATLMTWWKRQMMIIDVLVRWKTVPREHHKISADMFALGNYAGDMAQKISSSRQDAESFINTYINEIKNQMPDQGIVTLDTVDVNYLSPGGADSVPYQNPNKLINQLNKIIMAGLNIPLSIINGQDAGSYASELVISNYVSSKVIQIAERIKPAILKIIKERIRVIDPSLPYDRLDIKLELTLANSRLERMREGAIMASLGVFTDTEVRRYLGYDMLREDQYEHLVTSDGITTRNAVSDAMQIVDGEEPQTSESDIQHIRDAGENVVRGT